MLLAAGRGERMRPLTDSCPKPLLPVGDKSLLVWHIERLVAAGITDIVINLAHLGERIESALGDGARWGARIQYSPEPAGALETAGGITQALPLLGAEPFLAISGDIYCEWNVRRAFDLVLGEAPGQALMHLVMVPNPDFHPEGDFALADGHIAGAAGPAAPRLTFGNIGVYHPACFAGCRAGEVAKLRPLMEHWAALGRVSGERFDGVWHNLGTPDQLAALDVVLQRDKP